MAVKRMRVEIGYASYLIDPRDAIVMLEIANRMVRVEMPNYGKPWQQAAEQEPFVTTVQLVDYEPLALPAEPRAVAPEPRRAPDEEIPF